MPLSAHALAELLLTLPDFPVMDSSGVYLEDAFESDSDQVILLEQWDA